MRIVGPFGLDVTPSGDSGEGFEILAPDLALVLHGQMVSSIDLATGRLMPLGPLGTAFPITAIAGPPAAAATPDGRIFAIGFDRLFSFPRNAPAQTTTVVPLAVGPGEYALAAAFEPSTGELWGMTLATGTARLYTVDTATAAMTLRSTVNTSIPYGSAIDFDPLAPHALHIVWPFGERWVVDPLTGAATAQPPLALAAPAVTAAAYTDSFAGAAATELFVLDLGSGHLMTAVQGELRPHRGALALFDDFTAAAGFDIAGGDNDLVLAALQRPLEPFSRLYRIDLATGRLVELGAGVGGAPLSGLAIVVE